MSVDRRQFLQTAVVAGSAILLPRAAASPAPAAAGPKTGFEQRGGASWTTHQEELTFLRQVAAGSPRVRLETIGRTQQGRPLHLVTLGHPRPRTNAVPTTLFICTQHGNEPAGRETGLALLRDLAFATDPVLVRQLQQQNILVIPTANPDGREANTRTNKAGSDINRDHLTLTQPESQAMHRVIRDRGPDVVLDLHEYGPSVPVLYDDEVLYLWPRNLNVDGSVRDLSRALAEEYIGKGARAAGFTADEYGLYKVGPQEVRQTAGDEDEGICRNAVGLRHRLGILVESAVSMDPTNGPQEVASAAAVNLRRVASQRQVVRDTLRFMRDQGEVARYASESAPRRKTLEGARRSAPVYFYGADNDPPAAGEYVDPPPSAYLLDPADAAELRATFALHGIRSRRTGGSVRVDMGQPAEPVIPLLLDGRARRHVVKGKPA